MIASIHRMLRSLARAPTFTAVAVLTLALTIACTTAVFSVVDTIVLRGLPYRDAAQLRTIYERRDDGSERTPSYPTFLDWRTQAAGTGAIEDVGFVRGDISRLPGNGPEDRQITAYVSPGFFHLMATAPLLGRTFLPDEEQPGGAHVAVISYELFEQRFGGDRAAVGSVVDLDSVPTTIVGVMPPAFAYPNFGGDSWAPTRIWQPIGIFDASHPGVLARRGLHVDSRTLVRLRAGVDSTRAAAAMRTVEQRLAMAYPADQAHWVSVDLRSMRSEMFGDLGSLLLLISGAIGLVMLLACANVANLFLVRGSARASELAVRTALGASRWRLVRQLSGEALVIAVVAGALGIGLAYAMLGFIRHALAAQLPFAGRLSLDGRAVFVSVAAAMVAALIVGLLPAVQVTGPRLLQRIRSGMTAAVGSVRERRLRNTLVSVQFALAITLLVEAGLLLQSFRRLVSVPLGFDPAGLITFTVAPASHAFDAPEAAAALYARILDALHAVPGARSAAATGGALLSTTVAVEGAATQESALPQALYHPVSTEYLRTMHMGVLAGRWFTDQDMRAPMTGGLVVSQRLARLLWPGAGAVGHRITIRRQSQARADFGQPISLPVIGVVSDVREFGPGQDPSAEVYLPYTLEVWPWMSFAVRVPGGARTVRPVRTAVQAVDPAIEFRGEPTVPATGAAAIDAQRRVLTEMLAGFAAGALLIAAIGLYGVAAYGVAQRTREIGVRIALGASEQRVVRLVLRDGLTFVLAGAAVGLAAAAAATRLIRAFLFQTTAADPLTFLLVPLVLATVALAAVYLPARRASRIDPTIAIRSD